jgi:hypothetical protein
MLQVPTHAHTSRRVGHNLTKRAKEDRSSTLGLEKEYPHALGYPCMYRTAGRQVGCTRMSIIEQRVMSPALEQRLELASM